MHRKLWYEYQLPKNTASSIQHGEIAATAPSGSQPQQVARNIEPFLADAFDHKAARRIPTRHDSALLPRVPRLGKTGQSEGKRFIDSIADCFSTAVKSVLLAQRRLMVEANYENAQLRTEGSAWRHAALANRQATFLPGGGEALRLRLSIGSLVIPTMATLELSLPKLARGPVSPTPKRAKVRRIFIGAGVDFAVYPPLPEDYAKLYSLWNKEFIATHMEPRVQAKLTVPAITETFCEKPELYIAHRALALMLYLIEDQS